MTDLERARDLVDRLWGSTFPSDPVEMGRELAEVFERQFCQVREDERRRYTNAVLEAKS